MKSRIRPAQHRLAADSGRCRYEPLNRDKRPRCLPTNSCDHAFKRRAAHRAASKDLLQRVLTQPGFAHQGRIPHARIFVFSPASATTPLVGLISAILGSRTLNASPCSDIRQALTPSASISLPRTSQTPSAGRRASGSIDQYIGTPYRITTKGHHGGPGVARVKTYGDVFDEYEWHPESTRDRRRPGPWDSTDDRAHERGTSA